MFRGEILGVMYYSWGAYKRAWNKAVLDGNIIDESNDNETLEGILY